LAARPTTNQHFDVDSGSVRAQEHAGPRRFGTKAAFDIGASPVDPIFYFLSAASPPIMADPVPLQPLAPKLSNFCTRFPVSTSPVYIFPWLSRLT